MRRSLSVVLAVSALVLAGCGSAPSTQFANGDLGPPPALAADLTICSFNIQFLGNSTRRDDVALASILADYDIVVVQELVSPPFPGTFPVGS